MRGPRHAVAGLGVLHVHFGGLDDLGAQHAFIVPQPKRPTSGLAFVADHTRNQQGTVQRGTPRLETIWTF